MTSKKDKSAANAAQAVLDANREALTGFDSAVVHGLFTTMGASVNDSDKAKGIRSQAALELCRHAESVAIASRDTGATEIDKGWSANVRMMLPVLAKEGSPFVKVKKDDKGTRYTMSGYGMNVNSIARGYCQYSDVGVHAADAETFVECREAVQARRAEDLTPAAKALVEAKQLLTDTLADVRSMAVDGNDIDLINDTIKSLVPIQDALTEMHLMSGAESEETEAEAESADEDSGQSDDAEAIAASG
jgi:hypothetical protein